jgi:hypothetical protein
MKTHKWILLAPRRSQTVPAENPTRALRVNLLGQAAPIILVPGLLFAGLNSTPAAIYHDGHHAPAHHASSRVRNGVSDDIGSVRWMY